MNRLTNALFWVFYLIGLAVGCLIETITKAIGVLAFFIALAVCSAWCWVNEKVKKI